MVDFVSKLRYDVSDLKNLMSLLCSPEGCPWDREQTHKSIRRNLLEEAYEAADAIDNENREELIEELGDVLMQVIHHANIAERANNFTLDDIADEACKKLIRRHPHVFGDVKANSGDESIVFWEDIKREEKQHDTTTDSMKSIARSLPALWRAEKIQKKAAKVGFDFQSIDNSSDTKKEEIGNLLFSIVNEARLHNIDPEEALGAASDEFITKFENFEQAKLEK